MMNKEDYISHCNKLARQYMQDVEQNKIIVSAYIKQAVARSREDERRADLYFDRPALDRVFEFFSFLNINIKNKYQQFVLSPYQAWILSELFGWYYSESKLRRYRYGLIYTARKSGKSVFAVGIELYMQMYDCEINSETYIVANSREQAGHALEYAKEIVNHSPVLSKRLEVQQYKIIYKSEKYGKSFFQTKASRAGKLDSLNVSSAICDEFHEYPDLSLYNVLKSGTLSRQNPMILITSTAGLSRDKPFFNMLEIGKRVLNREIEQDTFFYALYTLDEGDDINNPDVWIKSNPNLGATITLEALISEYQQAKHDRETLINFITKNLNVYTDSITTWIPEEKLQIAFDHELKLDDFEGEDCYIGADCSKVTDLTGICLLFEREGHFYAFPFFFCVKGTEKIRQAGISLIQWIKQGFIIECQTETIDRSLIYSYFEEWRSRFNIVKIHYDRAYVGDLFQQVKFNLCPYVEAPPRTIQNLNKPTKAIKINMLEETITIQENPVMLWNFRNVVIESVANMDRISKNKNLDSVDGCIALELAFSAYQDVNDSEELHELNNLINGQ